MTLPMTQPMTQLAKKVLVDPHPVWGGLAVGIAAAVIFAAFATWIVVQRIRHGRESDDD